MINAIWVFMILAGVVVAALNGRMDLVTNAVLNGAKQGVVVCLGLLSIMVFWLGLMKIAEAAGLVQSFAKVLYPLARFLYPSVPKDHPAMGSIVANMSANMLGLGNAATPLGLKAMRELQDLNPDKQTASDAMCTLLAINTSGLTIIPATVIGLRLQYGSANPTEIVVSTLLATLLATTTAVLLDRWYRSRERKKWGESK
ncbi:spore maturation protein A [Tumebacillus sp. BK434]|uniref:nucleoside recognition domain-containing protein n=1 Tax=Tumebacillus sp. BK434 TaxID=2512169 RepID=UPI00104E0369|nr:nucleoside recognition domain-containing protein [Tumebacillus sp. BK434]TCP59520.1 spore maturation protein A [Tumebacillus sp. BK434]